MYYAYCRVYTTRVKNLLLFSEACMSERSLSRTTDHLDVAAHHRRRLFVTAQGSAIVHVYLHEYDRPGWPGCQTSTQTVGLFELTQLTLLIYSKRNPLQHSQK